MWLTTINPVGSPHVTAVGGADGGLQRPVGRPGAVDVYRVEPSTVFALGASEPFGATQFRLG